MYRVSLVGSPGLAHDVPVHTLHLQDFLPELQALAAHFHLSYDVRELRCTADEMELYSMVTSSDRQHIQLIKKKREKISQELNAKVSPSHKVWREFQETFRQQEQMKTFPQFGSTEVKQGQWGGRSAASALKKEANWIPFIRVGSSDISACAGSPGRPERLSGSQ